MRVDVEASALKRLASCSAMASEAERISSSGGLGTLYVQLRHVEEARATLTTAMEIYRALEMTCWLPQPEATLVQVEAR